MPDLPYRIGGYRIVRRLGQGGMGVVYLAEAESGTRVAVKVIHGEWARDPRYRRRFQREVRILRRVAESARFCTVPILDSGTEGDRAYLVTEFVDGQDLAERVARYGPLTEPDLLDLATRTLLALEAIHAAGVVHRDLKPGNVLLGPDGPKVIDFGIAQMADSLTLTTTLVGTPGYMSPEQALDHQVTFAADVFSWGAVTAFAATGRCPFGEGNSPAVTFRVAYEEPDLEGVDGRLRDVIAWALTKAPERRPTPRELYAALTGAPGDVLIPVDSGWTVPDPHLPPGPSGRPPAGGRLAKRLVRLVAVGLAVTGLLLPLNVLTGVVPLGAPGCADPGETRALPLSLTDFDTTRKGQVAATEGSWTVASPGGYTWTGVHGRLPAWCRLQVDLDVQVKGPTEEPFLGMGWGYGIGVCSRFDGSQPRGLSLQYAFYQGEEAQENHIKVVRLPAANAHPGPQPADPPQGLDQGTHHWRIMFDQDRVAYQLDYGVLQTAWYPVTGDPPLLADCLDSSFVLRSWLAEVKVRNVTVSPG
ncbi:serine/threonine-protein kinase [Acrocarpospora sp. B8E8]|uniref:serine/threonine-protein kinase n=1 Tax=Acrocarpospora sp. B8E8 TaxID=3153572 RepID=UPI00325C6564